jgi:hypothetical protein
MFTDTTTHATAGAQTLDHLYASTAAEAVPASVADDIADRIAIADPAELDDIIRDMRLDHTNGRLSIDDLDVLEEAAQTRRVELAKAARARTRKHLKDPRPVLSPEVCKRVGQHKAWVRALLKAGKLNAGDVLYLHMLLDLPTVRLGHDSVRSDRSWAEEMGIKIDTMRRRRRKVERLKLIAARLQLHGEDGNSCAVHPIMEDGTQVFPDPEKPTRLGSCAQGGCALEPTHTVFTRTVITEPPPLPPAMPDGPDEGRGAFDRIEEEGATHEVSTMVDVPKAATDGAEAGTTARQELAQPPAAREVPAQPPSRKTAPVASAASASSDAEPTFAEFWSVIGRTGDENFARARWRKLSPAGKVAAMACLKRPRFWKAGMYAASWLADRVWEQAPAASAPSYAVIHRGTPHAAVLEKLRGPIRWMSDMRTVVMDEPLRAALREVGP